VIFAPWDAQDQLDPTWSGFMAVSSSDPAAALPPPCAFPASDQNCSGLVNVTFRTPGRQTVTVFDVAGVLAPATIPITVYPVYTPVPDLDAFGRVVMGLALGGAAVTLLSRRTVS
jgi:hypothetical protein